MTKLEYLYLMNVALYLPTMKDVETFEQVNKKTRDAVTSLKVNPRFNDGNDIIKFLQIFHPETCDMNSHHTCKLNHWGEIVSNGPMRKQESMKVSGLMANVKKFRNAVLKLKKNGTVVLFWNYQEMKVNVKEIMPKMESFVLMIEKCDQAERTEEFVQFFLEINSTMRIEFVSLITFKTFEEEMVKQANYLKFYPKRVIVEHAHIEIRTGNYAVNRHQEEELTLIPEITDFNEKNILFLVSGDLSDEELKIIKRNGYNVYVNTFNKKYIECDMLKYYLISRQMKEVDPRNASPRTVRFTVKIETFFDGNTDKLYDILNEMYCQSLNIQDHMSERDFLLNRHNAKVIKFETTELIQLPEYVKGLYYYGSARIINHKFPFNLQHGEKIDIQSGDFENPINRLQITLPLENKLKIVDFGGDPSKIVFEEEKTAKTGKKQIKTRKGETTIQRGEISFSVRYNS